MKKAGANAQALTARTNQPKPRMTTKEIDDLKKVTNCAICKQKGHWARECPTKQQKALVTLNQEAQQPTTSGSSEFTFNVTDQHGLVTDNWLADSGASSHMCNDIKWFKSISKEPLDVQSVTVGNGQQGPVHGVGVVTMSAFDGNAWATINLTDVL